ncbi:M15 family metallopeptidase [Janibacter indicus]|uniref:D-alanyl-D-alanine carboxypeptidase n=1 Tax=Janibacter indicus TaxID=857417 RepID=A0A1W2CAB2_9MICO|nr:M15 family metallopeptidase [Janibacter indicus]SMC81904.1 D-alanyl-D-alanine carboxypeptidase [Janibacter indicus]
MRSGIRRRGGATSAAIALCLATGLAASSASAEPVDPTTPVTETVGPTTAPTTEPTDDGTAADPSTAWSVDESSPVGDANDTPLSSGDLEDQIAEADRLTADLVKDNKDIAAAVKSLKSYSTKANRLLQKKAKARDEYTAAKSEADTAQRELDKYRNRLAKGRKDLRSWAFDTYTQAGGYSDTMTMIGTLTDGSKTSGDSAGDLSYLTDERIRTVDLVREDTVTKASLTKKKDKALKKAASAKRRADRAKERADAVLKERKSELESLRRKHAEELKEAGPIVNALISQPDDRAQGASDRLTSALKELGQDVSQFEGSKPCSTNMGTYPNGQIPPSGLCPLLGGPGESLRPDAAAAFNAMSKAYQRDTGHLLCITDSYRSYAEQVVTKQQRGGWAATPGRSNHGLGKALDLCGGVNSFGHPAHAWMQQNAPLYGWFHPSWAAAGGSLPEPWHWEYAG